MGLAQGTSRFLIQGGANAPPLASPRGGAFLNQRGGDTFFVQVNHVFAYIGIKVFRSLDYIITRKPVQFQKNVGRK